MGEVAAGSMDLRNGGAVLANPPQYDRSHVTKQRLLVMGKLSSRQELWSTCIP